MFASLSGTAIRQSTPWSLLTIGLLLVLSQPVFGQTITPEQATRTFHKVGPPKNLEIDTDGEAKALVERILEQYGLKLDPTLWQIWVTSDEDDTPNAASSFLNGKRQIYFNKSFMSRISKGDDEQWRAYATAAHEIGHHLGNHVLRPWLRRKNAERDADYHAGFVLGRMNAPYGTTISVVQWLPDSSDLYPSREQRICEIGRGWRDAKRYEPIPSLQQVNATGLQICEGQKPDPNKFSMRSNRDIDGQDILYDGKPGIVGIDLAACAAHCAERSDCKAFSFDRWNGWCFPKHTIVESLMDPPSILGVKKPNNIPNALTTAKYQFLVVRNRRFRDRTTTAPVQTASFEECRNSCEQDLRCIAMSFIKSSKMCSKFADTSGSYIDDQADSGYKRQIPNR